MTKFEKTDESEYWAKLILHWFLYILIYDSTLNPLCDNINEINVLYFL